jgi:tRNA uridine 5-carboxymethylaminomethyl modification enzyme
MKRFERDTGFGISQKTVLGHLLRRPGIDIDRISGHFPSDSLEGLNSREKELLNMEFRYSGYIERQRLEVERLRREEARLIPGEIDYGAIQGLSRESVEKLQRARPATLGQAIRISGITPAAVALLRVHLEKSRREGIRVPTGTGGRGGEARTEPAG